MPRIEHTYDFFFRFSAQLQEGPNEGAALTVDGKFSVPILTAAWRLNFRAFDG